MSLNTTTNLLGISLPDDWQEDAACRDADISMFFSLDDDDQRAAQELCKSCPVQQDCLRFAIENREMYGIWGGMLEGDRRSLIRERRREARERKKRREQEAA